MWKWGHQICQTTNLGTKNDRCQIFEQTQMESDIQKLTSTHYNRELTNNHAEPAVHKKKGQQYRPGRGRRRKTQRRDWTLAALLADFRTVGRLGVLTTSLGFQSRDNSFQVKVPKFNLPSWSFQAKASKLEFPSDSPCANNVKTT